MIKIPKNVVSTIENSCKMNNVRGASDWRSMNDGKGHKTNIMHNLVQARKAEWFVWKVLSENKNINNFFSIIGNSFLLWDNQIWNLHHCFKHHSFTGTIKDPDIYHMRPFIRKSNLENLNKIIKIKKNIFPIYSVFILTIFPGYWLGQVISYNIFIYKKYLWKMRLNNYKINYFELLLKNEKNEKRKKIFLWIVTICEYLSYKDEKDYNHFDKVLTIIIGEVYELFNR